MTDKQREEMRIIGTIRKLFVHKDVKEYDEHIIASIAQAAAKMLISSDQEVNEENIRNAVIKVYTDTYANSNREYNVDSITESSYSMTPSTVNMNLGFSPDFNDYGHARAVYEAQKEEYDMLYGQIDRYQQNYMANKHLGH